MSSEKCAQHIESDEDEELDPRIQSELEKLNAATDGINHLETEFGEAQALFQQMMQDATFHLNSLSQQLGKSVEKSRPYYEAVRRSRIGHNQLHDAALKFEQAQSRHFNAKKRVAEAEKRSMTVAGKLDPALQEMLNQATIEVMGAASASEESCEIHRAASIEFDQKQKAVQVLFKNLQKHIVKSRPYFDLKYNLNKQLEIQKQRLEKIQEGITLSKSAYSDTLHNLEVISDDIHRTRQEKRRSLLLEQRGQGVGADSDDQSESSIVHSCTMENIRTMQLEDNLVTDPHSDTSSTDSVVSLDDELLKSDLERVENRNSQILGDMPSIVVNDGENMATKPRPETPGLSESGEKSRASSIAEDTENTIKETLENIDSSYEVITSHSLEPLSPLRLDFLPDWDFTDSGVKLLHKLNKSRRARSFTDLSAVGRVRMIEDISEKRSESHEDLTSIPRCMSMPQNERRTWGSFSVGVKPHGYNNSRSGTPDSLHTAIARVANLTLPALVLNGSNEEEVAAS